VRVGIVGSEAAKFTPETQRLARAEIRRVIAGATLVVSGRSPLGGIDIWAIEEAKLAGIETREFPPARRTWEGGYKQRNLQIAEHSDVVVCVTLKNLPEGYSGMRFPGGCYHCGTPPAHHVKSGGCWTMKQAAKAGKSTELVVIVA
jgi:hypothetical protein